MDLGAEKKFSHVANFTGYMQIVFNWVQAHSKGGLRILDLPAGQGLLAEQLRLAGHTVVCADINAERDDYVYADMSRTLPFEDGEFDLVLCMEGIEHLIEPASLIFELCRITNPKGTIITTTPNVQSYYSRLCYLVRRAG